MNSNTAALSRHAFHTPQNRREYWIFVCATFLCFSSTSQLAFLSVILRHADISEQQIGIISSAWSVAAIIGPALSPRLIEAHGGLRTSILGWCMIFLAFAGLQFAYISPPLAIMDRFIAGLGFGIFLSAGIVYVSGKVGLSNQIYYLGIFSSMMMVPHLFGTAVAEWYVGTLGVQTYFLALSLPILAGIIVSWVCLPDEPAILEPPSPSKYRQLLAEPLLMALYASILATGLLWGFVDAFLSLWLAQSAIPAALFFSPFAATMLASRFYLLKIFQRFRRSVVVTIGLLSMSLAIFMLSILTSTESAVLSSVLFGLGYSVVFPTVIVWGNGRLASELRNRFVALLNVIFNIGGVLSPALGGYLVKVVGFPSTGMLLSALGPIGALALIAVAFRERVPN
jgi:MFS transporter, DHA1 family, multidrug resistance protein